MRRRSVWENAIFLLSAHLGARALGLVLLLLLPRYLAPEELGFYFVAVSVAGMAGALAELGLRDPLVRELLLRPEEEARTFGAALGMRLSAGVVVLGAALAWSWANGYPPLLRRLVVLTAIASALDQIAGAFHLFFRARERMEFESLGVLLERAIVAGVGGWRGWCWGSARRRGSVGQWSAPPRCTCCWWLDC
ncbi:MAG: hypothetical protein KatS3mg115_0033 [Candidatus Poribacteria bacterium]|nr:MAG: hypothetical protein KatS3mg115_0033 [Candidatus Poribacteria bacterium]